MATDYAIVETGGKQYRVEKGDSLVVDRLAEDEGAKVSLRAVMFRGEADVVLMPSELEKVKVEAKVAAHERGPKIRVATYKAKKGYRRQAGHRSELTRLEVTDVKLLSRRPAKAKPKAADEEKPAAKAEAAAAAPAKPKAAAKPAAKAAAAAETTGAQAGATVDEKAEKKPAKPKAAKSKPKATKPKAKPAAKKGAAKPAAKRKTSGEKKES